MGPRRVPQPEIRAWTTKEWCIAVSLSRATAYRLMADGDVKYVTIGKARRIITSPKDFIAALERDQSVA